MGALGIRRSDPEEDYDEAAPGPGRRRLRITIRVAKILAVPVALSVAAGGLLLAFTPSAGQAAALAEAQAELHHIAYPGPPVPQSFAHALVATEDHRFYSDPGVDPLALVRLGLATITGSNDAGGSTIDQQLAKLLYTQGRSGGVTVEAKQVALAIKLNMTYSHAQILQMYAEVAYYGHGYYGLGSASCGYFGVHPAQLTVVQAAMLAGVVNDPTYDDPLNYPKQARRRRSRDRPDGLGRLPELSTGGRRPQGAARPVGRPRLPVRTQ